MGNPGKGWTPERRKRQSEAIRKWKPWSKSTGPKSPEGKAKAATNAWTRGDRLELRYTLQAVKKAIAEHKTWLDQVSLPALSRKGR